MFGGHFFSNGGEGAIKTAIIMLEDSFGLIYGHPSRNFTKKILHIFFLVLNVKIISGKNILLYH